MSELDEWVAANLRYLHDTCGTELPWTDATSNDDTSKEE
jgi:hypothetical protein